MSGDTGFWDTLCILARDLTSYGRPGQLLGRAFPSARRNTSIAAGVFDGDTLTTRFRIASDREMDADECAAHIAAELSAGGVDPGGVDGAVLSSTVPVLATAVGDACRRIFGVEPVVVSAERQAGVPILYDDPGAVGPDRILHAVAAVHRHTPPVIVVDFGTALVFDAVGRDGAYLGGTIAPGIGISAQALFDGAAMLNDVEVAAPPSGDIRNSAGWPSGA